MKTYTTEQLKEIINDYFESYLLLKEHFPKAEQKFKRLTNQLHELLEEVKTVFPDANYYTASGGFHLLIGNSHDWNIRATANPKLIALSSEKLNVIDGDY